VLLALEYPDGHENPYTSLSFYSQGTDTLLVDSKIQVNQESTTILIDYKVIERDIPIKEAGLTPQRLIPFNTVS
jgi:hypothetical protein